MDYTIMGLTHFLLRHAPFVARERGGNLKAWLGALLGVAGTALAGTGIVDPADYGFAPNAPNAAALQRALAGGRRIVQVTRPGVYGLDRTVWLDSDTRLIFTPGAVLQKRAAYVHVLASFGFHFVLAPGQ